MTAELTDFQRRLIVEADKAGYITRWDADRLPGAHFCPDWDFMLVAHGMPEMDACTCDRMET